MLFRKIIKKCVSECFLFPKIKIKKNPSKNSNATWEGLSSKENKLNYEEEITYQQALKLVTALIQDAQINIVSDHKYASQSRRFLMNSNGNLKYLLEGVEGINVEKSLDKLYWFATDGHRYAKVHNGELIRED